MFATIRRSVMALITALVLAVPVAGFANTLEEKPSALAMTGDAIFARPVLLAMTVVGAAVWIVSLPFSALGGNVGEAGEVLVLGPGEATFVRCLGCTTPGYKKNEVVNETAAN